MEEPLVKENDTAAEAGVTICMDTRPTGSGVTALATEDEMIEIVVARLALAVFFEDRHPTRRDVRFLKLYQRQR